MAKYSKKLAKFICDKVEDGLTVAEICRKHKEDGLPHEKTIWRWRRNKEDFKEMIDTAYQTKVYMWLEELEDLSQTPPNIHSVRGKYSLEDPRELKIQLTAEIQAWRERIATLKFNVAKIAPKMVPELSDKTTIEHKGENLGPQIIIQSYAIPEQGRIIENDLTKLVEDTDAD